MSETFVSNEIAHLELDTSIELRVVSLRARPRQPRSVARALVAGAVWGGRSSGLPGSALFRTKVQGFSKTVLSGNRGGQVDIVHAPFVNEPATVALLVARSLGARATSSAHAADWQLQPTDRLNWNLSNLDHIFPISTRTADALLTADPSVGPKMTIVRASVQANLEQRPPRPLPTRPKLVTIARLVPKKGVDTALRVVRHLSDAGLDVTYDIVGDGPELPGLQLLTETLGLGSRVKFCGAMGHSEALALLGSADLALLPARRAPSGDEDGIPVFLMEAALLGVPFLSTQVGAIAELVPEGAECLLPEDEVAAMSLMALDLLRDSVKAARISHSVRDHVIEHFDPKVQARRLVETWQSMKK